MNRNEYLTQEEIEGELKQAFGLERVIWLDHGGIAGDDTDSHVDILARFCDADTIAYTQCEDETDENWPELHAMEQQLKTLKTLDGSHINSFRFRFRTHFTWTTTGFRAPTLTS